MEIQNEFNSITVEAVVALEQRLSLELPEDYKQFILRHNGGYPTPNRFIFLDFRGHLTDSSLDYFLPIGSDIDDNVLFVYESMLSDEKLPFGMLPIAYDLYGSIVSIQLEAEGYGGYGTVFFWDQELELEGRNLSIIAHDFTEFIRMLY